MSRGSPIHRGPTFIALRARREAYGIANSIRNPNVDAIDLMCLRCRGYFKVLEASISQAQQCPLCRLRGSVPDHFAIVRENPDLIDPDVICATKTADAIELSCRNCHTTQWFEPAMEQYGIYCARCSTELVPPKEEQSSRCRKLHARIDGGDFVSNVARLLLIIIAVIFFVVGLTLLVIWINR